MGSLYLIGDVTQKSDSTLNGLNIKSGTFSLDGGHVAVNGNVELSGAVMEAVAAENYRKVTPTVYDVAMKTKYSRDPASAAMIDLIQQSVLINFESIYNEAIGNPWFIMRIMMDRKTKDFASYWAKEESKVEKALQKAVEQIREMDT